MPASKLPKHAASCRMVAAANSSLAYSNTAASLPRCSTTPSARSNLAVVAAGLSDASASSPKPAGASSWVSKLKTTWNRGLRLAWRSILSSVISFSKGSAWCSCAA